VSATNWRWASAEWATAAAMASTDSAIARVWAVIALGAVGAMVVFILLALVLSRWVLRPTWRPADAVAELTATLPKPAPRRRRAVDAGGERPAAPPEQSG
ncbi:hypothetical protein GV789_28665, partial [Nocardia cyriacigeorgica]|nr:hypothetical protein [Nocardia cyriacigeorgica]